MEHTDSKLTVSSGVLICTEKAEIVANCSPMGVPDLELTYSEAVANAARLALCWNTHDDLVEALNDIKNGMYPIDIVAELGSISVEEFRGKAICWLQERARAALSAARGEK